jgi:hypothetical protein
VWARLRSHDLTGSADLHDIVHYAGKGSYDATGSTRHLCFMQRRLCI